MTEQKFINPHPVLAFLIEDLWNNVTLSIQKILFSLKTEVSGMPFVKYFLSPGKQECEGCSKGKQLNFMVPPDIRGKKAEQIHVSQQIYHLFQSFCNKKTAAPNISGINIKQQAN